MRHFAYRLLMDREQSPQAEAFRSFRLILEDTAQREELKTILFTGTHQSDEYAMTAANVAVALAYAGKRVLLVDANLRSPSLYRLFHVPNTGLVELLRSGKSAQEMLQPSHLKRLTLLPSGCSAEPPMSLLARPRLTEILSELKQSFDYVLIHSAPLLVTASDIVSDACLLAAKTDGVILLVEACSVKAAKAKKAAEMLQGTRAKLLGLLMTRVKLADAFFQGAM
ncbi:MAG: CpsD/CapB family tyrosine-protein kinase [Sporomusaceae bacterium]|nr:CpsD/CapB family tyrosine-protein kinase [Sporomusaceae bacterium]